MINSLVIRYQLFLSICYFIEIFWEQLFFAKYPQLTNSQDKKGFTDEYFNHATKLKTNIIIDSFYYFI